jgi:hypothetical protein
MSGGHGPPPLPRSASSPNQRAVNEPSSSGVNRLPLPPPPQASRDREPSATNGLPPLAAPLPPMRRKTPSVNGIEAPVPTDEGFMSTPQKMSLANIALALRDEQLQAKVVHYRADLQTSPELDAITAGVIAELKALQGAAGAARAAQMPPQVDRSQLEIELIQSLKVMLGRIFRPDMVSSVVQRKLAEASKRFARIFFESELHDRLRGSTTEHKTMRFAEQALYRALSKQEAQIFEQLGEYEYESPDVKAAARERLESILREMRNAFLSRTTPELNALVRFLNEVLTLFFLREMPPILGEIAWAVVKEARLADAGMGAGYKLAASTFPRFRMAFEKHFLERLVPFVEDEMLKLVREQKGRFRQETIRFVADPQIFSDVCELVCDAVYDALYNDGFLDLPTDWRARLAASG